MRTVPFRTILEQVLGIMGQPFSINQTSQLEQACNFINLRVANKWDDRPWPELVQYQERAFAAPYVATRTYATDDVVWWEATDAYYKALSTTIGNAPTNPTYWEETTTPSEMLVEWEQYAQDKIGRVWEVWTADPRITATARRMEYLLTADGIVVPAALQDTVWIVFTKPASRYTSALYAEGTTYNRYDMVFYPWTESAAIFPDRGEVYQVEQDSLGAYFWNLVPFPAFLSGYVTMAAAADMLRHNGQKELAIQYEQTADDRLANEWDKVRQAGRVIVLGVAE